MPSPVTGGGAPVGLDLIKCSWAMYFATIASGAVIPAAKLGNTEPPIWVRQGRLKGDEFTWNVPAPGILEGRAGFTQVLKFYAVNKAEMPQLTVPLDEGDPEIFSRLRGGAAGAAGTLSSSIYTGYSFQYKTGIAYNTKVLLVGTSITGSAVEKHFYCPNAFVTIKPTTNPDSDAAEANVVMATDVNLVAFYYNYWQ